MNRRRRASTDLFLLAGFLLLFCFLSYRIAEQAPSDDNEYRMPHRTTFSNKPGGWKGLYLLLQERGVRVGRMLKSPADWPAEAPVMVVGPDHLALQDMSTWDDKEIEAALDWVDNGGTLFLLTDEDNALLEKMGLKLQHHLKHDATLLPAQPATALRGVHGIFLPGEERWIKSPFSAVSLAGDLKPAIVAFSHGDGQIIAVSNAAFADNDHLAKADNARFLVQALSDAAETGDNTGIVYFDEYHQGFRDEDSLWSAIGRPGQLIAIQLAVVALLAAYSAGRRFGLPRPLPTPPRVSSEYVTSLADLYRRAQAGEAALEGVYLSFWRDLCRAVGVPLDAEAAEVAPRAAAALGDGTKAQSDRLLRLLADCEAKIASGGTPQNLRDADLLQMTRALEAMRKELKLGGYA